MIAYASTRSRVACRKAATASATSGAASSPAWSWPPDARRISTPSMAAAMPVRSAILASKPTRMTPMAEPWPSTMALVASVVDSDTRVAHAATSRGRPVAASTASSASATPIARSPRVVSALALATIARRAVSTTTASV